MDDETLDRWYRLGKAAFEEIRNIKNQKYFGPDHALSDGDICSILGEMIEKRMNRGD